MAATGGLAGQCAIVTGGSRGIGLASARALAAAGANVVVTSRKSSSAHEAAVGLNERAGPDAGRVVGVGAHATDQDAAQACVAYAVQQFGRIDILVNNAGTNPAFGLLGDQDHGRFAKTFDVNLWAPLLWTTLVSDAWMRENGGAVVNVSSIGGLSVEPNLGIYNATKAALMLLTRQFALELAPRVRVNAVAPGVVRSRLAEAVWTGQEDHLSSVIPMGRIGNPVDVAAAIAFLASDAASWITGATLVVDGGMMLGDATAAGRESERRSALSDG